MSIMGSIKQALGVGGVKVGLTVPGQVEKSKGQVEGKVTLSVKSDQQVLELTVTLTESYSTGRGDEKTIKDYDLGEIKLPAPFEMKAGEVKEVPFTLPFTLLKSDADILKEKGGALGLIGKAGAFANAEKSTYKVKAEADVKGTMIDPSDGSSERRRPLEQRQASGRWGLRVGDQAFAGSLHAAPTLSAGLSKIQMSVSCLYE